MRPTGRLATLILCVSCSGETTPPSEFDPSLAKDTSLVSFDDGVLTTASIGQALAVKIHAQKSSMRLSAWLEGDYADASLASDDLLVQRSIATIQVNPPSRPREFTLVVQDDGGRHNSIRIRASANGDASLRVIPRYSGRRAVPDLWAVVFPDRTCDDAIRSDDFESKYFVSNNSGVLSFDHVPAGKQLAVVARVRSYAFGCVDLRPLAPNSSSDLTVTVRDEPLTLSRTELDATLSIQFDTQASLGWDTIQKTAINRLLDAFATTQVPEEDQLLDAFERVSVFHQGELATRRVQGAWKSIAASWVSSHGYIRSPASKTLGLAKSAATGPMNVRITSATDGATVAVSTFGVVPAGAFFQANSTFTYVAGADDSLTLGGVLKLDPVGMMATVGDARAGQDVSGVTGIADSIRKSLSCTQFAEALQANDSTGLCGVSCLTDICNKSISDMWSRALVAAAYMVRLDITAGGKATIGDHAEPSAFDGTWVGSASATDPTIAAFPMGGWARGTAVK